MRLESIRIGLVALGILCVPAGASDPGDAPAEVVILATLHQYHDDVPGYAFSDLAEIVEGLQPDVLALELTPTDLESRRDQAVKREYPQAVYPLLEKHDYAALALEPDQPKFDEIVGRFRDAQQSLHTDRPEHAEAFGAYTEALYATLFERLDSAAAANSASLDVLFDSKHRFQSDLFGAGEADAWQAWNEHFLEVIMGAAQGNPGARIVVMVGLEHAYWLRKQGAAAGLRLADTEALLRELGY